MAKDILYDNKLLCTSLCTCLFVYMFVYSFLCVLQVRVAVAEAIGFSVQLVAADALNDQLPRLIPGIVQLYKKHQEHYHISQVGVAGGGACLMA